LPDDRPVGISFRDHAHGMDDTVKERFDRWRARAIPFDFRHEQKAFSSAMARRAEIDEAPHGFIFLLSAKRVDEENR
ncbi:hypothetical protein, partial [Stenotrophomonas maltophilia]|uniref:hypothetical protein n=1 Tax=Stenotrophomonas maltophilia TaxID=40324 RepID=UPI001952F86D